MAPTVGSVTTTTGTTLVGGASINMPTHASGDLILVVLGQDLGTYPAVSASGSWVELEDRDRGNQIGYAVYGLIATGSSETLTLTGPSGDFIAAAFIVQDHGETSSTLSSDLPATATGRGDSTTGNGDPMTFNTMEVTASESYIVIALAATDADCGSTTVPSGYTGIGSTDYQNSTACGVHLAYKLEPSVAGNITPGNWSMTTGEQWVTGSWAIKYSTTTAITSTAIAATTTMPAAGVTESIKFADIPNNWSAALTTTANGAVGQQDRFYGVFARFAEWDATTTYGVKHILYQQDSGSFDGCVQFGVNDAGDGYTYAFWDGSAMVYDGSGSQFTTPGDGEWMWCGLGVRQNGADVVFYCYTGGSDPRNPSWTLELTDSSNTGKTFTITNELGIWMGGEIAFDVRRVIVVDHYDPDDVSANIVKDVFVDREWPPVDGDLNPSDTDDTTWNCATWGIETSGQVGETAQPTIIGTTTMPTPTVSPNTVATLAAIQAVAALPTPTVDAGSNEQIAATAITLPITMPTPSIGADAAISDPTIVGTVTLPTPTVTPAAVAALAAIELTTTMPGVALSADATLVDTAIAVPVTLPAPVVASGDTPQPEAIAVLVAIPTATIALGAIVAPSSIVVAVVMPAAAVSSYTVTEPVKSGPGEAARAPVRRIKFGRSTPRRVR